MGIQETIDYLICFAQVKTQSYVCNGEFVMLDFSTAVWPEKHRTSTMPSLKFTAQGRKTTEPLKLAEDWSLHFVAQFSAGMQDG